MELADLLVGAAVAIVGLYLTHNLRRQQRLRVAEQRMASYQELWKLMEIARPTRLETWESAGPLTRDEARDLYAQMTHWYFGAGHGMLLTETTKRLYLKTKESLGRYVVGTNPNGENAGRRAIYELSLLRRQMTLDLHIFGVSYFGELEDEDEAFLRSAKINPQRWGRPPWPERLVGAARRMIRPLGGGPRRGRTDATSSATGVNATTSPGSSVPEG